MAAAPALLVEPAAVFIVALLLLWIDCLLLEVRLPALCEESLRSPSDTVLLVSGVWWWYMRRYPATEDRGVNV